MARRLPSLNALRAFEATGRRLSMNGAALELGVTPGAISQQIKRLEEDLGLRLFERRPQGLALTEAGLGYLANVRQAFDGLIEATERLSARHAVQTVTVSTMPSFAIKWLVPRLGRFRLKHPELDVRLSATTRLVDFVREGVDGAIRHGLGRYAGLRSWLLLPEELIPVCSPRLVDSGPHPLRTPADLRHHVLLHDSDENEWTLWLKAAGIEGIDPRRGPSFSDNGLLLEAAIAGQGVAISRGALIEQDVAAGRLVVPFDLVLKSELAYYFICPEASATEPKLVKFRDWLLEEAGAEPAGSALGLRPPASPRSGDRPRRSPRAPGRG